MLDLYLSLAYSQPFGCLCRVEYQTSSYRPRPWRAGCETFFFRGIILNDLQEYKYSVDSQICTFNFYALRKTAFQTSVSITVSLLQALYVTHTTFLARRYVRQSRKREKFSPYWLLVRCTSAVKVAKVRARKSHPTHIMPCTDLQE